MYRALITLFNCHINSTLLRGTPETGRTGLEQQKRQNIPLARGTRIPPPAVQFLSFSCSFGKTLPNNKFSFGVRYQGLGVGYPLYTLTPPQYPTPLDILTPQIPYPPRYPILQRHPTPRIPYPQERTWDQGPGRYLSLYATDIWWSSVADPGFSPGGCANSQICYYFSNICWKLHEN